MRFNFAICIAQRHSKATIIRHFTMPLPSQPGVDSDARASPVADSQTDVGLPFLPSAHQSQPMIEEYIVIRRQKQSIISNNSTVLDKIARLLSNRYMILDNIVFCSGVDIKIKKNQTFV